MTQVDRLRDQCKRKRGLFSVRDTPAKRADPGQPREVFEGLTVSPGISHIFAIWDTLERGRNIAASLCCQVDPKIECGSVDSCASNSDWPYLVPVCLKSSDGVEWCEHQAPLEGSGRLESCATTNSVCFRLFRFMYECFKFGDFLPLFFLQHLLLFVRITRLLCPLNVTLSLPG